MLSSSLIKKSKPYVDIMRSVFSTTVKFAWKMVGHGKYDNQIDLSTVSATATFKLSSNVEGIKKVSVFSASSLIERHSLLGILNAHSKVGDSVLDHASENVDQVISGYLTVQDYFNGETLYELYKVQE